jgi:hypothetical protein
MFWRHCAHSTAKRRLRHGIDYARTGNIAAAQQLHRLMCGPTTRWRERGGRAVRFALPFDDIMEIALALLGWSFPDRKRLLDHFLASGKSDQRKDRAALGQTSLELRLPLRDVRRLRSFVHRELPKAASSAALLDRLGAILDAVS